MSRAEMSGGVPLRANVLAMTTSVGFVVGGLTTHHYCLPKSHSNHCVGTAFFGRGDWAWYAAGLKPVR
jgi:hypothetical protein